MSRGCSSMGMEAVDTHSNLCSFWEPVCSLKYLWTEVSSVYTNNHNNLHFIGFSSSYFIHSLLYHSLFLMSSSKHTMCQILVSGFIFRVPESDIYTNFSSPTECLIKAFRLIPPSLPQDVSSIRERLLPVFLVIILSGTR